MAQITSLFDLIDEVPNPIPANTIPFYDGCNRTLIPIPNGITCIDVQACIDAAYICSFITAGSGITKS